MLIYVRGRVYFLLLLVRVVVCEIAYEWNELYVKGGKHRNWRPTSFEFSGNKFYITLIDTSKCSPGVGVVAWFKPDNDPSPPLSVHGDPKDYKIYYESGTIKAPMLIRADPCGDIWVMDGNIYNITGTQVKQTPIFHIYDKKTEEKHRIHHFQDNLWDQKSLFINLVFQVQDSVVPRDPNYCAALIVYLADFNGFRLFAYHYHEDISHRYSHPAFLPDPYVDVPDEYLLNKEHQKLTGIYGLALAKTTNYGSLLFFHPLAGTTEYVIPVEKLKNESVLNYADIRISYDKGKYSEAGKTAYDPLTETFFFAELKTRRIGCLNLHTILNRNVSVSTYGRYDIKLKHGVITDLKVVAGELWMLTYSQSKTTLRKESVSDIIKKANCIFKFKDPHCESAECRRSEDLVRNDSRMTEFGFYKLIATIIMILTF